MLQVSLDASKVRIIVRSFHAGDIAEAFLVVRFGINGSDKHSAVVQVCMCLCIRLWYLLLLILHCFYQSENASFRQLVASSMRVIDL